jgi:hypothetical protein
MLFRDTFVSTFVLGSLVSPFASASSFSSITKRSLVAAGGWSLSTTDGIITCPVGTASCFGDLTGNKKTQNRGENCCPSGTFPRLDCGTYVNTGQPYACCPLSKKRLSAGSRIATHDANQNMQATPTAVETLRRRTSQTSAPTLAGPCGMFPMAEAKALLAESTALLQPSTASVVFQGSMVITFHGSAKTLSASAMAPRSFLTGRCLLFR